MSEKKEATELDWNSLDDATQDKLREQMDAAKPKIIGYTPLTPMQVSTINEIKEHGIVLEKLVYKLRTSGIGMDKTAYDVRDYDRWIEIGRAHLQQGIMALVRSVAEKD